MLVSEIMTHGVECIQPETTLQEAAKKMKELDVGLLPVCGADDRLAGMVTDRDIVTRGVAEGADPKTTQAQRVMTPEVVYCFEDQSVEEAARLMKSKQIRRLVVLNRDKRLVGVMSLGDLAIETDDEELAGATVEAISEPAKPKKR